MKAIRNMKTNNHSRASGRLKTRKKKRAIVIKKPNNELRANRKMNSMRQEAIINQPKEERMMIRTLRLKIACELSKIKFKIGKEAKICQ